MTLLPEVRAELVATATRRAALIKPGSKARHHSGTLTLALGAVGALAVAIVALFALGHRAPTASTSQVPSGARALIARLAVLRRPQTPADRSYPSIAVRQNRLERTQPIASLTRLAATVTAPGVGPMRVYLIVSRDAALPITVRATAVAADGKRFTRSFALSAHRLGVPGGVQSGLFTAGTAADPNIGVTVSIVPDGVTGVKWSFSGAGYGIDDPHPVTVYPLVRNNVAVASIRPGQGPLVGTTWYGAGGQVIGSAVASNASWQLRQIQSVNASRNNSILPFLLAHFGVFRSVPPDLPSRDPTMPMQSPGDSQGLNYWQTRYVSSLTGLDGRGLWVTPGSSGMCLSDPQASACGWRAQLSPAGFIGTGTVVGHEMTLEGMVPDGNRTITVVLANGKQQTTRVVDNLFEVTVPGRIVAIIDRTTTARVERHSLQ